MEVQVLMSDGGDFKTYTVTLRYRTLGVQYPYGTNNGVGVGIGGSESE